MIRDALAEAVALHGRRRVALTLAVAPPVIVLGIRTAYVVAWGIWS